MKIRIRISRRVSSRQARSSLVGASGVETQPDAPPSRGARLNLRRGYLLHINSLRKQAQFSDMNRNVTWNSFNAYLAERQAGSANILNVRNGSQGAASRIGDGVGEVNALHNAVSPNRIIQLAVKIFF